MDETHPYLMEVGEKGLHMLRVGMDTSWSYGCETSMAVDFCLWALEMDGLRVAPFDQHADGDAALRHAGLTAQAWQAWFEAVVAFQGSASRLERVDPPLGSGAGDPAGATPPVAWPDALVCISKSAELWAGAPAVGALLAQWWERYVALANGRRARASAFLGAFAHREGRRALWQDLAPYRARLPSLKAYLVAYPARVLHPIPPASFVVALGAEEPSFEEFHASILRAAEVLAAS